jgi:hypothetical protein
MPDVETTLKYLTIASLSLATLYILAPTTKRKRTNEQTSTKQHALNQENQEENEGKKYPPGLKNIGNTCFINATLQSLASCSCLLSMTPTDAFSSALLATLTKLNQLENRHTSFVPSEFLDVVDPKRLQRRYGAQQDVHELYQLIFELLPSPTPTTGSETSLIKCTCGFETRRVEEFTVLSLVPDGSSFNVLWNRYFEGEEVDMSCPLESLHATRQSVQLRVARMLKTLGIESKDCRCLEDLKPGLTETLPFAHLDFEAEPPNVDGLNREGKQYLKLWKQLHALTLLEKMSHDEYSDMSSLQWKNMGVDPVRTIPSSPIIKSVFISRWPRILAIHMQRSVYEGRARKNVSSISPPVRLGRYDLVALLYHFGVHDSGHFVAVVKRGGRWWRISDGEVEEVDGLTSAGSLYFCLYETSEVSNGGIDEA